MFIGNDQILGHTRKSKYRILTLDSIKSILIGHFVIFQTWVYAAGIYLHTIRIITGDITEPFGIGFSAFNEVVGR